MRLVYLPRSDMFPPGRRRHLSFAKGRTFVYGHVIRLCFERHPSPDGLLRDIRHTRRPYTVEFHGQGHPCRCVPKRLSVEDRNAPAENAFRHSVCTSLRREPVASLPPPDRRRHPPGVGSDLPTHRPRTEGRDCTIMCVRKFFPSIHQSSWSNG
jgi:hypothetical protein